MKKYDLWWYNTDSSKWVKLNSEMWDYEKALEFLKANLLDSLDMPFDPTLFKIAEHDDANWMQRVPQYLLEKGSK